MISNPFVALLLGLCVGLLVGLVALARERRKAVFRHRIDCTDDPELAEMFDLDRERHRQGRER